MRPGWLRFLLRILGLLGALTIAGCSPARLKGTEGLTAAEVESLSSLRQVDPYPLYTLRISGGDSSSVKEAPLVGFLSAQGRSCAVEVQACSLFAALGDGNNPLYGRNFDWDYSPALLLFYQPADGYASAAMVDLDVLGLGGGKAANLTDLPLKERKVLLEARFYPYDGMNERGLAVGMAAVPAGEMVPDPAKATLGSLQVIREMLDHAATSDEAIAILENYNIDMRVGPPLHYLVADSTGHAALVEFYKGKMTVLTNDHPWHEATNFLLSSVDRPEGNCWRYDRIQARLEETQGKLSTSQGLELLSAVSQDGTQWSVIYAMKSAEVWVVMGKKYDRVLRFSLKPGS